MLFAKFAVLKGTTYVKGDIYLHIFLPFVEGNTFYGPPVFFAGECSSLKIRCSVNEKFASEYANTFFFFREGGGGGGLE